MKITRLQMQGRAAVVERGFGLIELMIALVLGLVVVGAAGTIFISNQKSYRATESLGRVQEGARVAFELMARDIREAAGNPCSKNIPVASVLSGTDWWATWGDGIRGYDGATALPGHGFGTAPAARAAGTDAIDLRGAYSGGVSVTDHNATSAQFKVSTKDHGLQDSDIAMVCDFTQAAVFQITNAQPGTNNTVVHNKGSGVGINCSKGLGYKNPMDCSTNGTPYTYGKNSVLVKMRATQWYIGHNANGGLSLYQSAIRNNAGTIVTDNSEITDGVKGMTLQYLIDGATSYVAAASVADWKKVEAVRILVELEGLDKVSNKGEKVIRKLSHVATLRNRVE